MEDRIPIKINVTLKTAKVLLDIAHDKFNDSLGKAVDYLTEEWRKRESH